MTSDRISTSSSRPGRPPKKTSTISSKLNSQNGSRRLRGVTTWRWSPKQWPYSLCRSSRKMRRFGRAARICCRMVATAARFADAGRAQHREMPAQQLVDVDVDADRVVLLQVADVGVVAVRGAIDDPQFLLRHEDGAVADLRVALDAALEACHARDGAQLADQLQPRDAAGPDRALARRVLLLIELRDHPDDHDRAAQDSEKPSDGRMLVIAGQGRRGQAHGRLRAGDRDDAADGLAGCR